MMIKSELKLEAGFAPEEFEPLSSLDELFSSQQNPSCAAPRAEEALAPHSNPPPSQQHSSCAAPGFVALPSFDDLLSSHQYPSCAAPSAENALNNCKHMMEIVYLLVTCYVTMCIDPCSPFFS
ncbi:e1.2 [Ichnoviriform fugitivi]|uniref:E1.2 n=1 Tax=Ichnoviriform fugitivi TaxID=265522 RepID=A2Q0N7_9VIRU|nr:e1.2 [Ichnoviriform fugitivi]BAF45752.1 e1.2 [Ichnoviriform fugitivi]